MRTACWDFQVTACRVSGISTYAADLLGITIVAAISTTGFLILEDRAARH